MDNAPGIFFRKIGLVIFDLDGTLINAYTAVESSINFTLRRLGFPRCDAETIRRSVGWGDRHLLEGFVGSKQVGKALRIYRRHHAQALQRGTKFLPGAERLLQELKEQKYKLAVASNRPTQFSRIALRHLNIEKFFDYILCADKLKKGKPHPEILILILKKLGVKRSQALYVGDMTIDVQTGRRAGVKTVAIATGSSRHQELKQLKPFKIIKRIDRLSSILDALNKEKDHEQTKKKRKTELAFEKG